MYLIRYKTILHHIIFVLSSITYFLKLNYKNNYARGWVYYLLIIQVAYILNVGCVEKNVIGVKIFILKHRGTEDCRDKVVLSLRFERVKNQILNRIRYK